MSFYLTALDEQVKDEKLKELPKKEDIIIHLEEEED